jgi:hypothetical protein
VVPLIMGAVGYSVGLLLSPEAKPPSNQSGGAPTNEAREILYKMPLGKFTIQVMRPSRIMHIRIDMDVYVAGAAEFEKINGSKGRARLRDATISAISDLAESMLWLDDGEEKELDKEELAKLIVLKIYRSFPMIRSARVNEFDTTRTARL